MQENISMTKITLEPIDTLNIVALMDNMADPFSKGPKEIKWNESEYRINVLKKESFCGADFCRACNGLSLFIKAHHKHENMTLLFDAGPDENLVVENAVRQGVDLQDVDGIVLSHGHFDHYGGMISVLKKINKTELPVYTHPDLFTPRAFDKGKIITCSYNLTYEDIELNGGKIVESTEPIQLFNNKVLISGEVPRVTSYEEGSPAECRKVKDQWEPAPLVIDERILIFNLKNKGLCVFTACGHTGVINALKHAIELTGISDVHLVMGGFHLAPSETHARIEPTLNDMIEINPSYIISGHCTGMKAQMELTRQFNERHIPYGVGTVFRFSGDAATA